MVDLCIDTYLGRANYWNISITKDISALRSHKNITHENISIQSRSGPKHQMPWRLQSRKVRAISQCRGRTILPKPAVGSPACLPRVCV